MDARSRITTTVVVMFGVMTGAGPALARPFDINSHGSYVPAGSASMHPRPGRAHAASQKLICQGHLSIPKLERCRTREITVIPITK